MTVSLIHFLNICLILTSAFPWVHSIIYSDQTNRMQNFSKSFISSFIFVCIFFYFLYSDFYASLLKFPNFKNIIWIFIVCILSILFENLIFYFKYKKTFSVKIPKNLILVLLISIIIPVVEEILFRGILKYLFDLYNLPAVIFICISSFCFGLNHLCYSKMNVLTKTVWGIFLSLSYCFTGNLFIPIISHISMNLIYVIIAIRKKNYA